MAGEAVPLYRSLLAPRLTKSGVAVKIYVDLTEYFFEEPSLFSILFCSFYKGDAHICMCCVLSTLIGTCFGFPLQHGVKRSRQGQKKRQ